MGDGLVARYADTAGNFATRHGQINQVGIVHSVHIGPAGQDFAEVFTGHAGAGKHAEQMMPILCVDRVAQRIEVVTEVIEDVQNRLTIGEEDVMPHQRVAAGNPREIAETTSGITENLQILAALGQRIDQTKSQQVRQMAGGCEHLVMVLHLHVFDIGTQRTPEAIN